MTFKASDDGEYIGAGISASVLVASGAPAVGQMATNKSVAARGETVHFYVKTNSDATHLIMYSEGGGKVRKWAAEGNSYVSGTVRVWDVTYAFGSAGNRTMTFRASRNGGATVGNANKIGIKIASADVTAAAFNSSIGYVKKAMGITVKTNSDMKYLYMYSENGALIKRWAASGNSTVSGSVRTWNVNYTFGSGGNRRMTFKASIDGAYIGKGKTASVLMASGAPAVGLATFNTATAAKRQKLNVVAKTNSDATHLIMYRENGKKVKTWAASGNSYVSGTVRVWQVSYSFSSAGKRTMTFKASRNGGSTVGVGKSVVITIK